MTLYNEHDFNMLAVDPTIMVTGPDGRPQPYIPFRLGIHSMQMRREHIRPSPLGTPGVVPQRHINGSSASVSSNGSPMTSRSMPPPQVLPRMPSNGVMRPPVTPTVPAIPQQSSPHRSPSAPNGIAHESNVPNGDTDVKLSVPVAINVGAQAQADDAMQIDSQPQNIAITSPVRPKSQTPSMTAIPNGFTIPSVNNFSSHIAANGSAYSHYAGMRNGIMAKSALAATLAGQDGGNGGHLRQTPSYMPHGVNYASQLQAARQMQYAALQQRQQITLTDGAIDANLAAQLSPPINGVPQRVPSANGNRPVSLNRGLSSPALAQAMAAGQGRASPGAAHLGRMTPHPPHSPPNLLSPAQQHGSPPRPMPSPSLQARQIVGSSSVGY